MMSKTSTIREKLLEFLRQSLLLAEERPQSGLDHQDLRDLALQTTGSSSHPRTQIGDLRKIQESLSSEDIKLYIQQNPKGGKTGLLFIDDLSEKTILVCILDNIVIRACRKDEAQEKQIATKPIGKDIDGWTLLEIISLSGTPPRNPK